MKRLFCLILMLTLLSGCAGTGETAPTTQAAAPPTETTLPTETTVPVETTIPGPTLLEQAEPWDAEGVLLRLPLSLTEETSWLEGRLMGEKLLFWEFQHEYEWISGVKLWVVDLDYGTVTANITVPLNEYVNMQVLDGKLYISDSTTGFIKVYNDRLELVREWNPTADQGYWYIGRDDTLFTIRNSDTVLSCDLETGEEKLLMDRVNGAYIMAQDEKGGCMWYSDVDLGAQQVAYLDFINNEVVPQPIPGAYYDCDRVGETWLLREYYGGTTFRLTNGEWIYETSLEGGLLEMTAQGHLLQRDVDGHRLFLYDQQGRYLSGCTIGGENAYLGGLMPVWCDALEGYLLTVSEYMPDGRDQQTLLLWKPEGGVEREDLVWTQVERETLQPDGMDDLRLRAQELGERFHVKIWLGNECLTDFSDFTAVHAVDPERIATQLDFLELALSGYPEGFIDQLYYDNYQMIHIHLVADLTAKPHYGTGGSYGAFVQPNNGYYLMVINTNFAAEGTYYHEFSHIIDDYLEWDSWHREDALYSEEGWAALNPPDFEYTWNYGVHQEFSGDWDKYFIDHYAMTNPTEDRARTLEYGMYPHMEWRFDEMAPALEKLRWYAACIRDAFDTTLWPEVTLWEQYLQ